MGETITANVPAVQGGAPDDYSIVPPLPAGLMLNTADGTISGQPTAETPLSTHTVTASNTAGQTQDSVDIQVGPALPAAFLSLEPGFAAEVIIEPGVPVPAKIAKFALAPPGDDRIFYLEVDTGNVRVLELQGAVWTLLATPFATINVLNGGHMGLLGLALAPDFGPPGNSGHVYVLACIPGDGMTTVDRIQVRRYTDAANVGTNEQIMIDGLPVTPPGGVNNGGELLFDLGGDLFVSLGDVQDSNNSQSDYTVSLAGKVLRWDVSTVPATPSPRPGNLDPNDPEWCRGLRNTFGLAVHPATGDLFGVDNGPAADDELNYMQPGKNFEWGGTPPPPDVGFKIRNYQTVIVPTAICWHDGTGWGAAYANDLFLVAYDDQVIRRFEMSGSAYVDIDAETQFAELVLSGDANHPLDVCMADDGSLYVSTFSGIYRITKL